MIYFTQAGLLGTLYKDEYTTDSKQLKKTNKKTYSTIKLWCDYR